MEALLSKKHRIFIQSSVMMYFLARRSLEDMPVTEGQYQGYRVVLQAATGGATPSEGPLNQTFRPGN